MDEIGISYKHRPMQTSKSCILHIAGLLFLYSGATTVAAQKEIPRAFGPYTNLTEKDFDGATSFKSSDKIVGTYYFYWYCIDTKEHIINPENGSDGLQDHPPTLKDF